MLHRRAIVCVAVVIALWSMLAGAQAFDETKYPDLKGQWQRRGSAQWDPAKPAGRAQQPPLTPEYQAIWDSALAELAEGRQSYNVQALCIPSGMPRMMIAYEPMEVIVTPEVTYILIEHLSELRRIYTDGRSWPEFIEPSFSGYSIGKWIDTHGDGRFDVLEVETRGFKGPRSYDSSGIPLHADQQSVIKERIYLDPGNPGILRDEVTTVDHALTKPWTVTRSYHRADKVIWTENICTEDNHHVIINHENYFINSDGYLMPTQKNQRKPDLKFFEN